MPVEIRELIIRFTVDDKSKENQPIEMNQQDFSKKMKGIINECVETVLQKIEKRLER
jgi:hypothetical protein